MESIFLENYPFSDRTKKTGISWYFSKNWQIFFQKSPKKFINRSQNWTQKVETFFSVFGYKFFPYPIFPDVRKCDATLKILLREHVVLWSSDEGIPRSAISIEFPLCCNSLFSENTKLNSFIKATMRIVLPVREPYFGKSVVLCLASQSP